MRSRLPAWTTLVLAALVCGCSDSTLDPGKTRLPAAACCPTWLSGDSIVIYEDMGIASDGVAGLMSVSIDGSTSSVVYEGSLRATLPSVSPSGAELTFVASGQIYRGELQGGMLGEESIVRLSSGGLDFFPSWSPDGSRIAYDNIDCGTQTEPIPDSLCGVMVMMRDGSNPTYITRGRTPSWSPDGTHLLYRGPNGEVFRVYLADHAAPVQVSNFGEALSQFGWTSLPVYDPGQLTIAAEVREGPERFGIWLMNADGSNPRRLVGGRAPSWSSSGEMLVFTRYGDSDPARDNTVWMMDMLNRRAKQLTFR